LDNAIAENVHSSYLRYRPPLEQAIAENVRSSYLNYLPALYSKDEFLKRLLMIFVNIMAPIQWRVDHIELCFDPKMMPEDFLPWIADWLDLVLDENWPLEKRRALVGSAVELYQWRGTRRGLKEYLRVYTGAEPVITEHFGGIRLENESKLGYNTVLGGGRDHCFTVTLELEDTAPIDEQMVKAIIEAEKPAHTAYTLELMRKSDSKSAAGTNSAAESD